MVCRYTNGVPADLPPNLVPQLKSFLTTADISILANAVGILTLLLQISPDTTFPEVERDVLKDIYAMAQSPLVSGAALDALLGFFGALVEADNQIAAHVVPSLKISAEKATSEVSSANVAKCIAQIAKSQQAIAAGIIADFSKQIKVLVRDARRYVS